MKLEVFISTIPGPHEDLNWFIVYENKEINFTVRNYEGIIEGDIFIDTELLSGRSATPKHIAFIKSFISRLKTRELNPGSTCIDDNTKYYAKALNYLEGFVEIYEEIPNRSR